MRNSFFDALSWRRLIVVGAMLVLAAAVWTSHGHGPNLPGPGQSAASSPLEPVAAAPALANPHDPAGWRALGEAKFAQAQYSDAIAAYAQAVAQAPGEASTWSALGEARVMASAHDPMPAEALKDFREASSIDPHEPRARYFLAVARDLTGDHRGAITAWLALLRDTPPGAPWEADLRRTIEQVGRIHHIAVATQLAAIRPPAGAPPVADITGPTAQDLAAASAIPPSQQQTMAQAMVARLEQRLAADPHNADGWVMLIRSRMTLDGPAKAAAVLAQAVAADRADEAQLRAQAEEMGVE